MIKWTGKSTDKRWIRTVEAETYRELMEDLVDRGYIGNYIDSDSQLFHELAYASQDVAKLEDRLNDEDQTEQALIIKGDGRFFKREAVKKNGQLKESTIKALKTLG